MVLGIPGASKMRDDVQRRSRYPHRGLATQSLPWQHRRLGGTPCERNIVAGKSCGRFLKYSWGTHPEASSALIRVLLEVVGTSQAPKFSWTIS